MCHAMLPLWNGASACLARGKESAPLGKQKHPADLQLGIVQLIVNLEGCFGQRLTSAFSRFLARYIKHKVQRVSVDFNTSDRPTFYPSKFTSEKPVTLSHFHLLFLQWRLFVELTDGLRKRTQSSSRNSTSNRPVCPTYLPSFSIFRG